LFSFYIAVAVVIWRPCPCNDFHLLIQSTLKDIAEIKWVGTRSAQQLALQKWIQAAVKMDEEETTIPNVGALTVNGHLVWMGVLELCFCLMVLSYVFLLIFGINDQSRLLFLA